MKKKIVAIISGVVAITTVAVIFLISFLPNKATKSVIEQIDSIGKVSLSSKEDIDEAFEKYNALTDREKSKVSNYDILVEDQKILDKLQLENNCSKVISLIESLGKKEPKSLSELDNLKNEIDVLYDSLTDELKAKVSNYADYSVAFVDRTAYCIEFLSKNYNFAEATEVLNKYDDFMTEEQHIEALKTIGEWSTVKAGESYNEEKQRENVVKGVYIRSMECIYKKAEITEDNNGVYKAKLIYEFITYADAPRFDWNNKMFKDWFVSYYTFEIDVSNNTVSNITLVEK